MYKIYEMQKLILKELKNIGQYVSIIIVHRKRYRKRYQWCILVIRMTLCMRYAYGRSKIINKRERGKDL